MDDPGFTVHYYDTRGRCAFAAWFGPAELAAAGTLAAAAWAACPPALRPTATTDHMELVGDNGVEVTAIIDPRGNDWACDHDAPAPTTWRPPPRYDSGEDYSAHD